MTFHNGVEFVLDRKEFRRQVLQSEDIGGIIHQAAERAAAGDRRVQAHDLDPANGRVGSLLTCPAGVERAEGALTRAQNEVRVS